MKSNACLFKIFLHTWNAKVIWKPFTYFVFKLWLCLSVFRYYNFSLFRCQIMTCFIIRHPSEEILSYIHSRIRSSRNLLLSLFFFFPPTVKPCSPGRVKGFVGGGGNIAIAAAIPPLFCVLYCKHRTVYGISLFNLLRLH